MANEKRLIDANALGIGKAKREVFDNPAYADGWNSAISIVENAPTVDAVEVVHGRWEDKDWNGNGVSGYMACSACNVMIPTPDDNRYCIARLYFCPNCGAKMDGGETA